MALWFCMSVAMIPSYTSSNISSWHVHEQTQAKERTHAHTRAHTHTSAWGAPKKKIPPPPKKIPPPQKKPAVASAAKIHNLGSLVGIKYTIFLSLSASFQKTQDALTKHPLPSKTRPYCRCISLNTRTRHCEHTVVRRFRAVPFVRYTQRYVDILLLESRECSIITSMQWYVCVFLSSSWDILR
jgi:hypothetical protein